MESCYTNQLLQTSAQIQSKQGSGQWSFKAAQKRYHEGHHAQSTLTVMSSVQDIEPPPSPHSPRRQLLQTRQPAIENIAIAAISITITILPNRLIRPPPWNRPGSSGTIPRQHQGTRGMERSAIPRARRPPVISSVDHRPARRLAVVGIDEVRDPVHHRRLGEAVACRARGVVFDV